MRLIRQIVLLGLASYLGTSGLFAQAQKQDGLAEQIARLPWGTDQVVIHLSAKADSKIVLVAHYANPGAVSDTDTGYVSIHPYKVILDKNGGPICPLRERSEMHFKCRDGNHWWCNGGGNFEKATKDGFDYDLSLSWKLDKESEKKFDETFHCHWVKEQTFKKDGFVITITAKLK